MICDLKSTCHVGRNGFSRQKWKQENHLRLSEDTTCMWNRKKRIQINFFKKQQQTQIQEKKGYQREKGWEDKLGVWGFTNIILIENIEGKLPC